MSAQDCPPGETVREHYKHGGNFSYQDGVLKTPAFQYEDTLMAKANRAGSEILRDLARSLSSAESQAGLATALGITVIMGRLRTPFPVALFCAITGGAAVEKAYARYLGGD